VSALLPFLALAVAGFVASVLNVLAGGGSFLTLPILIFLGLPPGVANGTNRLGILAQNVTAVWGFRRHRLLGGSLAWAACGIATAGAGLGTWLALVVSDALFKRALAVLMVLVTLWTLLAPPPKLRDALPSLASPRGAAVALGFFAAGVYGGFVQAGVGFLLLAVTTLAGLDLVRGNALKVASVLAFTLLALGGFTLAGRVAWAEGAALAAGSLAGGALGVRVTVLKGHRWVKRVVTVAVIAFAIALWLTPG